MEKTDTRTTPQTAAGGSGGGSPPPSGVWARISMDDGREFFYGPGCLSMFVVACALAFAAGAYFY